MNALISVIVSLKNVATFHILPVNIQTFHMLLTCELRYSERIRHTFQRGRPIYKYLFWGAGGGGGGECQVLFI